MPRILLPAAALLIFANGIAPMSLSAGEPQASSTPASATVPAGPRRDTRCLEVEVNGERVPDYACLGQLMTATPAASPPAALPGSERIARRPPTELGLANRAATQQRMGNAFGVSTRPQRPPPPPPPPVIPGR